MKEIWVEKYRPKTLDEVVGQDEIVERLKAYAKEANLPHLLFAGPAGTGKTTSAMALARDMFGENWRQNYYELNSSDERGIETVRTKVKEIARLATFGGTSFKIIFVAEGDMRRAVNSLQVAASLGPAIDADVLYKVASTIRPEEVKKLIEKALEGEFLRAREVLDRLLIEYGLSGEDIVRQLHRSVFDLNVPDESKVRLLDRIGETDFRLTEGSSERIQIEALLAHFALIGQDLSKK